MSTPSSPVYPEAPVEAYSSPPAKVSRTVAIIKNHALDHRFEIEQRISEAGFEIVKERQMEFEIESDPDTMYELFGEDYVSFAEGPVWVYVLERRRAIEVWQTLMGDADPEIAREETSNSLRALYGLTKEQNAVMGSPDMQTADIQIHSIFASSPPFPTSELPDVGSVSRQRTPSHEVQQDAYYEEEPQPRQSMESEMSRITYEEYSEPRQSLESQMSRVTYEEYSEPRQSMESQMSRITYEEYSEPRQSMESEVSEVSRTSGGSVRSAKRSGSSGSNSETTKFRARPLPPTHTSPDIVPRMSRAAALRAGIVDAFTQPKHYPATAESLAKTFAGVPGHKRAEPIPVASTLPPVVPPRMTRAASLRLGLEPPTPHKSKARPSTANGSPSDTFDGVPGHKRRETISVASTKPPTVAPRSNRSAALRVMKEAAPPSSFNLRVSSSHSRSSSRTSMNPTNGSRTTISRPASAVSVRRDKANVISAPKPTGPITNVTKPLNSSSAANKQSKTNGDSAPVIVKARVSIAPPPPTIAPRTNKSALLRAAKMALTPGSSSANGKTPAKKQVVQKEKAKPVRA